MGSKTEVFTRKDEGRLWGDKARQDLDVEIERLGAVESLRSSYLLKVSYSELARVGRCALTVRCRGLHVVW